MSDFAADHNSTGGVAADRLRSLVERFERLEAEKKALSEDQRDILTEGASAGFDKKALRQLIRLRAQDPQKLREYEDVLDVYRRVMGI